MSTFTSTASTATKECSRKHNAGLNKTVGLRDVSISALPSMPPSRYTLVSPQRKVEMLRTTEARRGFAGHPVKVSDHLLVCVLKYFSHSLHLDKDCFRI